MAWRVAKGLLMLRAQINAKYPGRKKDSDGTIGNAEHSARTSDHNPDTDGVVKALDTTHDPAHGFDSYAFSDMLIRNRDPRIKYVISNRRIASGPTGPSPWIWRKYTGANPHDHHNHVSIRREARYFDDEMPWKLDGSPAVGSPSVEHATSTYVAPRRTLAFNSTGKDVAYLQRMIGVKVTSKFDQPTLAKTITLQKRWKLTADGRVGPMTWAKIED